MLVCVVALLPACVSKKKFEAATRNANRLKSQKEECERNTRTLQDSLNATRKAYQAYKSSSEANQAKMKSSYEQQLADLRNQNAGLKSQIDELTSSQLSREDYFGKQLRQQKEELEKLRSDLSEKERLLANREARVQELEALIRRKDSLANALLSKVRDALRGFSSDELTVEERNGKIYVSLSEQLLFASGSAEVNSKGRQAIGKVCEVLNRNPDIQVMIEGHTDNIPIKTVVFKDNWDLSVIRATSIVRIMYKDYKVPAERITPAGHAEFLPVADNATPDGRAKNRRTEIVLSPNLDELFKLLQQR